jgi:hypothetical protein
MHAYSDKRLHSRTRSRLQPSVSIRKTVGEKSWRRNDYTEGRKNFRTEVRGQSKYKPLFILARLFKSGNNWEASHTTEDESKGMIRDHDGGKRISS